MEFERVFYKNDFASGAKLLNLYMICEFVWLLEMILIMTDTLKSVEQTGEI
jgi:hypothetical protein